MVSPGEISLLCRLCLVKDQVNVPIFGEQGDIRQIFLKISSCLPVTVSKEDQLPKNICEGCSDKLDLLFAFWNSSRDAEKTLVSWLKQASVDNANETINAIAKQISAKPVAEVKQETDDGQNIKIQQSSEEGKNDESEEAPPPPKRARRTAAVKAQISISQEDESEEEEDDVDAVEPLTKVEDESDMSDNDGADNQPLSSFVDMPGTSADDQEQAGPSGVGKDGGADAPDEECQEIIIIKQQMDDEDDDDDDEEEDKEKVELKKVNRPKPKSKTYKKREKKDKFTCNYCDRKFFDKTDMDEHIVMAHTKEFRYYCDTCGKGYYMLCKKKYCEQRHERKTFKDEVLRGDSMWKNPKESNNWLCHYCSKMFFNPATYHRHLKKHANGTEVFKCEMCSKWLSSSYNLNAHMKLHTGERNAVCETCGSKYRTVGELNVHRAKVHGLKQKRFKCRICDKEFKYFPYLKKHFVNYHPNDNIPESSEMFKITDKETEKDETIIIVSGGEDDTDTDSDNTTQVYSISVDDVIL